MSGFDFCWMVDGVVVSSSFFFLVISVHKVMLTRFSWVRVDVGSKIEHIAPRLCERN